MSTYRDLRARVDGAWLKWFTAPYDLNIVGIRRAQQVDVWNDTIAVAYVTPAGVEVCDEYEATTDPGADCLREPGRVEGTAILYPGQHRALWKPGLHRGKYPALVQVGACRVYRDANRDTVLDLGGPGVAGVYGINLHHGGGSSRVGEYSAGCQVVRHPADLAHILSLVERQRLAGHGDVCSYTLLESP